MKSETIGKLAEALAKAQAMMDSAKKDSTNPFFKNKYADLNSVIEAIKEPLAANGLSYAQLPESDDSGHYLTTILMHTSGEWLSSKLKLMLGKADMQGLGGSITYARRYQLSSIVGISQDDDDGNTATGKPKEPLHVPWSIGPMENSRIQSLSRAAQWSPAHITAFVTKSFNKKFTEMDETEFSKLCHVLETAAQAVAK